MKPRDPADTPRGRAQVRRHQNIGDVGPARRARPCRCNARDPHPGGWCRTCAGTVAGPERPTRTPTRADLDEALTAIHELLCEAEKHNQFQPTREQTMVLTRLIGSAIEWCKTHKQPEWGDRLAARRARRCAWGPSLR